MLRIPVLFTAGVRFSMSYNIAILLRADRNRNRFRSVLLACFASDELPNLFMGSGFFQEYVGKKSFLSSAQFSNSPPSFPCEKKLMLVGLYSSPNWLAQYASFADAMTRITCPCGFGISVLPFRMKSDHWHAKIFLAANNNEDFKVGVIGSSNMTSRTFGLNLPFNHEADIVLWDNTDSATDRLVRAALEAEGSADNEVILATYDGRLSIPNRLGDLYDQIIEVL